MAEGTGSRADRSTDDDRIRIPTSGPDVVACRPRFLFDNRVNFTEATRTKRTSPVWSFRCFASSEPKSCCHSADGSSLNVSSLRKIGLRTQIEKWVVTRAHNAGQVNLCQIADTSTADASE